MKTILLILFLGGILEMNAQENKTNKITFNENDSLQTNKGKHRELTEFEKFVILEKGTELAFSGKYYKHKEEGTYHCKHCDAPLYKSSHKFDSSCGWPSFDDEIKGAIKQTKDKDGIRTEITCSNCDGHLGHIFYNEGFTHRNVRHCVNSVSLHFKSTLESKK